MSKYPEEITDAVLAKNAHISDGEIATDALDTLSEITMRLRLGIPEDHSQITERREFIAFLHRLQLARLSRAAIATEVAL